jgi:hypothetical protein
VGGRVAQAERNTPAKTTPVISEMNFSAARSGKDVAAGASNAPMNFRPPHPSPD